MAREHAVLADRVGAHAQQRRRVDVQRHGRIGAGVAHAVDVRRGEVEARADRHVRTRGGPSIARRSSRTAPLTTATAPAETSWS